METRRCSACGESKPLDQFKVKAVHADRIICQPYCISCQRDYRRRHYRENKAYYIQKVREREACIRRMIKATKMRPCADCGIQYATWQMDFDHVRGTKVMGLARKDSSSLSVRSVQAEIAKCEVVCANCHRERTHLRRTAGGESKPLDSSKVKTVQGDSAIPQSSDTGGQGGYRRHHYLQNKQEYLRRKRERDARIRDLAETAKARPCADCGIQYAPWKMDFDHVSGSKVMGVANLVRLKVAVRTLLAEIAKCEVVCANCHRNRTYLRRLAFKKSPEQL
jgi:hypothetical protein